MVERALLPKSVKTFIASSNFLSNIFCTYKSNRSSCSPTYKINRPTDNSSCFIQIDFYQIFTGYIQLIHFLADQAWQTHTAVNVSNVLTMDCPFVPNHPVVYHTENMQPHRFLAKYHTKRNRLRPSKAWKQTLVTKNLLNDNEVFTFWWNDLIDWMKTNMPHSILYLCDAAFMTLSEWPRFETSFTIFFQEIMLSTVGRCRHFQYFVAFIVV